MDEPNPRPAALALSVKHDWPTRFVSNAAEQVVVDLHADQGFAPPHIINRCDFRGTFVQLYADLREITSKVHRPGHVPRSVLLGFASGHGSLLGMHSHTGELLVDDSLCQVLREAILVFCSCLKDGQFPVRLLNFSAIPAIIGYKPFLRIGPEQDVYRWAEQHEGFDEYRRRFTEVLVQPVRSLLRFGCTALTAVTETQAAWNQLATNIPLNDPRKDICLSNGDNLHLWGQPNAILRS